MSKTSQSSDQSQEPDSVDPTLDLSGEIMRLRVKLGVLESAGLAETQIIIDAFNEIFYSCGSVEEQRACGLTLEDRKTHVLKHLKNFQTQLQQPEMGKWPKFAQSKFLVFFSGEVPSTKLVHGFEQMKL